MGYEILYYSDKVAEAVASLPLALRARYFHLTDRMEQHGPDLGMPHTRAMKGGLFELRVKGAEGIARVFYCTMTRGKIVILHSFIKKTDKAPGHELAIAKKRMKEVRNAQP